MMEEEPNLFGDEESDEDEKKDYQDIEDEEVRVESSMAVVDGPIGEDANVYLLKLPYFLNIEPEPYDPLRYKKQVQSQDLPLVVENTIRWRQDASQGGQKSSNARLIRWSDDSLSLLLGDELFEVAVHSTRNDRQYLAVSHPSITQTRSRVLSSMTFRPHGTGSNTHRKLQQALESRFHGRDAKAKFHPTIKNPELEKEKVEKAEMERLKAKRRLETKREREEYQRYEETYRSGNNTIMDSFSHQYDEEDDEDDLDDFVADDGEEGEMKRDDPGSSKQRLKIEEDDEW